MSATPTTSVWRGGTITHLLFGSIGQLKSFARRLAGQLERAVNASTHGTSIKNINKHHQRRRVGRFGPSAFNPAWYRRAGAGLEETFATDRKSTRLNSSHLGI